MTKRTTKSGFEEGGQSAYETAFGPWKKPLLDRVKLGEGGRLVIPAAMREALGVKPGDDIALEIVDGELRVKSYISVIKDIQARVKALVPPGVDIVEDFLAERRKEQRRSEGRFERLHSEGMAMRSDDK